MERALLDTASMVHLRAVWLTLLVGLIAAPAAAQLQAGGPIGVRPPPSRVDRLVRLGPGGEATLRGLGVAPATAEGRALRWRDWVLVRTDEAGAAALDQARPAPGVVEVRRLPPAGIPPLRRTTEVAGLARGVGRPADDYTGEGVLIADLDSHVDVYHPDFFYGDAGYYSWIDQDGDGVFTPGVDAVDLSEDGEATESETGQLLAATLVDLFGVSTDPLRSGAFDPAVDWIYLDVDGDGRRGFGAADGFTDASHAFGEPLFVPDDVNRDGVIGPAERFVRLGGSKLRAVYTYVDARLGVGAVDRVYRRGTDLASTPGDITGGVYGFSDTLHASAVLGVLIGGVPLPSRTHLGIVPGAEAINAFEIGASDAGRLIWSLDQSPDVVLHEYVSWTGGSLDGSDAVSMLIDGSADRSVHVCPVGNIGGAGKHAEVTLADSETRSMPFTVDPRLSDVQLSVFARGAGTVTLELVDAAGAAEAIPAFRSVARLSDGGSLFSDDASTTSRGTWEQHMVLSGVLAGSGWSLRATAAGGEVTLHGMLADQGGFGRSSAWTEASDASTVALPATADRCVAVGSIPGHPSSEGGWYRQAGDEAAGVVRAYSARGPRIDGDLRPHLVAPDNPWAPVGVGEIAPSRPGFLDVPLGGYRVFGGTSGAGPHVAGAAAILVASGLGSEDAVGRLTSSAGTDGIGEPMPSPNYGFGRLRIGDALGDAFGDEAPTVTLTADPPRPRPGDRVTLTVQTDPGVEVRWDDGYDGTWDTAYGAETTRVVTPDAEGAVHYKVRARGPGGRIAEASVVVVAAFLNEAPDAGVGPGSDAGLVTGPSDGDGCGCRVGGAGGRAPLAWWIGGLGLALAWRRRRAAI